MTVDSGLLFWATL